MTITKNTFLLGALLFSQSALAYNVELEINNDTDQTITTPGLVEEEIQGVDNYHNVPTINKIIPPHKDDVPIDVAQKDIQWWGLLSLSINKPDGTLIYPCLEDTYWGVAQNKVFQVTIKQYGKKHPYYQCSHN